MAPAAGSQEQGNLTVKQRRFVEAYLGPANFNASKAARLAGYSEKTARVIGLENLTKPAIEAAIQDGLARLAMPANEVLHRLADQARGSLEDFIEVTAEGWTINLQKAKDAGKLHLLHELGWTKDGPKIKLYSAAEALVNLGRHHKLFTEKHEHSGPNGGPIPVTTYEVIPPDGAGPGTGDE